MLIRRHFPLGREMPHSFLYEPAVGVTRVGVE